MARPNCRHADLSVQICRVTDVSELDWNLNTASLAALQFVEWLIINDGRSDNFTDEYQTDQDRAWAAAEARCWVETVTPNRGAPRRLADKMPQPTPNLTGEGYLKVEEVGACAKTA